VPSALHLGPLRSGGHSDHRTIPADSAIFARVFCEIASLQIEAVVQTTVAVVIAMDQRLGRAVAVLVEWVPPVKPRCRAVRVCLPAAMLVMARDKSST
jgi:hypothetical protein